MSAREDVKSLVDELLKETIAEYDKLIDQKTRELIDLIKEGNRESSKV